MVKFTQWPIREVEDGTLIYGFSIGSGSGIPARMTEMVEWCTDQFGPPCDPGRFKAGDRWMWRYESVVFSVAEDAVAFRVRWC